MVKGHVIIQELVDRGVHLLPATVDAHMMEGPALTWL
jgi:hypothetical protein